MTVPKMADLELLKIQHTEWDRLLLEEEKRPMPDAMLIQSYKKHKLEVKQKIEAMEKILLGT